MEDNRTNSSGTEYTFPIIGAVVRMLVRRKWIVLLVFVFSIALASLYSFSKASNKYSMMVSTANSPLSLEQLELLFKAIPGDEATRKDSIGANIRKIAFHPNYPSAKASTAEKERIVQIAEVDIYTKHQVNPHDLTAFLLRAIDAAQFHQIRSESYQLYLKERLRVNDSIVQLLHEDLSDVARARETANVYVEAQSGSRSVSALEDAMDRRIDIERNLRDAVPFDIISPCGEPVSVRCKRFAIAAIALFAAGLLLLSIFELALYSYKQTDEA